MTKRRINLSSRDNTINSYLVKIEDNIYEWHSLGMYYRVSHSNDDENEIHMLDADGGPAIVVGSVIEGRTVSEIKRITENDNVKYLVYFENKFNENDQVQLRRHSNRP